VELAALPVDLRDQIEEVLYTEYRQVRELLAHNRAAVTKLAEGLMLHEQAGEADLSQVLAQIEARHPFVGAVGRAAPHNGTPAAYAPGLYARRAPAGRAARSLPFAEPVLPEEAADTPDADDAAGEPPDPPDTPDPPEPPAEPPR
jgi:hypothetical protein